MDRRNFLKSTVGLCGILMVNPALLIANEKKNTTAEVFSDLIAKASKQKWQMLMLGDLISRVSLELLNTPYVGGKLDTNLKEEQTIINLVELDCVTFFENSVSIARCIKKGHFRFADLVDEITLLRYRDGKIVDYTSRLHYTSDWITNNIKKNIVQDITQELDGEEIHFDLYYMSENPQNYPVLKANPEFVPIIRKIEETLSKQSFYVIKPNNISKITKNIRDGDIIAIATSSPGLDYSHTGLAFNGKLLHASSKAKKVIIGKTLSDYVKSNPKNIGISVLRPLTVSNS